MNTFRCKMCGREFEELPASCFCGNSNPVMWDIFPGAGSGQQPRDDAPQPPAGNTWQQQMNAAGQPANNAWQQPRDDAPQPPAGNTWQQQMNAAGQPANNAWQQPASNAQAPASNAWQQPQAPNAQPPAYAPPQGMNVEGKKKKKTVLIVVIVVAVVAALCVGGYFLWEMFSSGSDVGENTETTTEDAADLLTGKKLTFKGVSFTLPDEKFEETFSGSDAYVYDNEDAEIRALILDTEAEADGFSSLKEFMETMYPEEIESFRNIKEYSINGHDAISFTMEQDDGLGNISYAWGVAVDSGDTVIIVLYRSDEKTNSYTDAIAASLDNITVG